MKLTMGILLITAIAFTGMISNKAMAAETGKNQQTVIVRAGELPSSKGTSQYFSGDVSVDPIFRPNETSSVSGSYVTFAQGARTAWHTHPAGQRLIITAGAGLIQEWGGPILSVKAGDSVWFPPGVKHWHGASPNEAMTHIALTGVVAGKSADWMELVSDEQYNP